MFLVAGVSGNTGSKVANLLLEKGEKVRVLVRDEAKGAAWKAKGCEVAVGSLKDPAFVSGAFEGIASAYLLLPPALDADDPIASGKKVIDGYVEALSQNDHLETIAFLSSLGAQYDKFNMGIVDTLSYAEAKLLNVNVQFFFLRAAYFFENWMMSVPQMMNEGVLYTFLRESFPIPMVSTSDIAAAAVEALLDPTKPWDVLQVAGPREYNSFDVANAFGAALGKPIKVVTLPTEQMPEMMGQMGMKPKMGEAFRDLYDAMHMGRVELKDRPFYTYRGHVSLEDFAADAVKAAKAG
ncbi:MAG: NmrA family NAD(P)-binding protein [Polyangiaceae bacterium]|nr:NmrA family NAD(P)-binding protein [Polyangiaceae bacterium]